ncbi:hypothetical protein DYB31_015369, partial [Aphanomyces astaci]
MLDTVLADGMAENIATCRESVALATQRLFDDITVAVQDSSSRMNRLTQRSIQDSAVDVEVSTLNKFVRFVCDKVDVRNVDGLVALAQAFVWNDPALVDNFIHNGKNVVVYAKESSCSKPPALEQVIAAAKSTPAPPLAISPPTTAPEHVTFAHVPRSPSSPHVVEIAPDVPSKKRALNETSFSEDKLPPSSMDPPPFAKKQRPMTSGVWEPVDGIQLPSQPAAATSSSRRNSQRVFAVDDSTSFTGTMPKSKREAIDRIADLAGAKPDADWIVAKALELYSMTVHPDYARKILSLLPEAVTTERLIDNPVEHYSRDPMERATTLNDFMRFLREMTSVANLDGLISLAQAFVWGDLGMVSSFHKHGVPVVVHGSKSNSRDLRWHAPLPVIVHLKPPTFTSASAKHKGMPSTAVESAPLLTPPPAAAHNADDIIEELYQALRMQVRESKAKKSMQDTILPDQAK